MAEYKLPFTGQQIEERLRKVDTIPTKVSELANDSVFVATYGVTTYQEIMDAYQNNYNVFLQKDGQLSAMSSVLADHPSVQAVNVGAVDMPIHLMEDADGIRFKEGCTYTESSGYMLKQYYTVRDMQSITNPLYSMKISISTDGFTSRLDIGGTEEWSGLSIYKSGDSLVVKDLYGFTTGLDATLAFPTALESDTFLLQALFLISDSQVELKIFVNGEQCGDTVSFTLKKEWGGGLGVYTETTSDVISISSLTSSDYCDAFIFSSASCDTGVLKIIESKCWKYDDGSSGWSITEKCSTSRTADLVNDGGYLTQQDKTQYKYTNIFAGNQYKLRKAGMYIACGTDYGLNLYDSSEARIGQSNCLAIIIFITDDNHGFVLQNYKSTVVSTIDSFTVSSLDGAYLYSDSVMMTVFHSRADEV